MIKFKNIYLNIGLINNEVKMKKLEKMKADNSQKENENYMQSLKSNESLKKVLFKAKNISTTLMTNIVPQLATSVKNVVAEMRGQRQQAEAVQQSLNAAPQLADAGLKVAQIADMGQQ